jgi:Kef-type K+ transport system membrane component KefB
VTSALLLTLIVAGAYLAAHSASEWLARRHLIVSGAEYLLLGVLLGPEVAGALQSSTVGPLAPFLTLAFGWVGALVGAQFYVPDLLRIRAAHFAVATTQAVLALSATAAATVAGLVFWLGLGWQQAWVPALATAAIAVSSAPTGAAVVALHRNERGVLIRQLQVTAAMDGLVAIMAFGILLAVSHTAPPTETRPPTPTEWAVITVAIGLVGGALFHLFVGPERKIDRLFIALCGALILTSGAAAHLRLSPLLPAFLVGLVLVNTSPARQELRQVLTTVERPLYFVLLVFAGAAWRPEGAAPLAFALLFVVGRVAAKVGGARLAARLHGEIPALGLRWGWGLVGHGGLAVAIALNYRLYDASALAGMVFSAALVSVLVTDLLSARLVQALVVAAPDPRHGGSAGTPGEGAR